MEWVFDPGELNHTEVSLAIDPNDGSRVQLAWHEAVTRVWIAFTENGGANWTVEYLRDPRFEATLRPSSQEAFDPTSAFGPSGERYVLFGGVTRPAPETALLGGITLARNLGDGWQFFPISESESVHVWDAMHLAVAPDTGHLYVTAQSISHRTIGLFMSEDRGNTWSIIRAPHLDPAAAPSIPANGYQFWPRIGAGADGTLVLATKAALGNQPRVVISRDGGATFGAVEQPSDTYMPGALIGNPIAIDDDTLRLVYASDDGLRVFDRSDDTWGLQASTEGTAGWSARWAVGTTLQNGSVAVLHTAERDTPKWRVHLSVVAGQNVTTTILHETSTTRPNPNGAGDEYGGIAVGGDGRVWAAWAHPGEQHGTIHLLMWPADSLR